MHGCTNIADGQPIAALPGWFLRKTRKDIGGIMSQGSPEIPISRGKRFSS
jgi:hypothetical protein